MLLSNASSKYGAQMGRPNRLPADRAMSYKLNLIRLRWVDGDYDQGGAYWGGPVNDSPVTFIYWAYEPGYDIEVFVRAASREDAKKRVRYWLPNARFYR